MFGLTNIRQGVITAYSFRSELLELSVGEGHFSVQCVQFFRNPLNMALPHMTRVHFAPHVNRHVTRTLPKLVCDSQHRFRPISAPPRQCRVALKGPKHLFSTSGPLSSGVGWTGLPVRDHTHSAAPGKHSCPPSARAQPTCILVEHP